MNGGTRDELRGQTKIALRRSVLVPSLLLILIAVVWVEVSWTAGPHDLAMAAVLAVVSTLAFCFACKTAFSYSMFRWVRLRTGVRETKWHVMHDKYFPAVTAVGAGVLALAIMNLPGLGWPVTVQLCWFAALVAVAWPAGWVQGKPNL